MAGRIGSTLESGPAITCMKLLLTIFNCIFWLSGILILVLGVWMKVELYMYIELTTLYIDFAPYILIGVGSFIVLFGSFGCFCTMKGHGRLLYVYVVILVLVFVMELAVAIGMYVYRSKLKVGIRDCDVLGNFWSQLEDGFNEGLGKAMQEFGTVELKRKAVDGIQSTLKCCGSKSYEDWYTIDWTGKGEQQKVPLSCCKDKVISCDGTEPNDIHQEGCFSKISSFMEGNFSLIGGVAIGFSFLQLLGALLTCCLARNLNKARYEQVD